MGDIEDAPKAVAGGRLERKCGACSGSSVQTVDRNNPIISPISTSVFELFKIGIGPSSSHTVGPMIACRNFGKLLVEEKLLSQVSRVQVILRGSLALTGIGHYTDKACILGLTGAQPSEVDTSTVDTFLAKVRASKILRIGRGKDIDDDNSYKDIEFEEQRDILLIAEELPLHPNGMICRAFGEQGVLKEARYYSIGGGFILSEDEMTGKTSSQSSHQPPIKYNSMGDLLEACKTHKLDIAGVMRRNEEARRPAAEVEAMLEEIADVMNKCVNAGLLKEKAGEMLPGPLGVVRRAPEIYENAMADTLPEEDLLPSVLMDELRLVDCYALAVMEENATMGRIVTAPTNGAAGVVPALLTYYIRHLRDKLPEARRKPVSTYLLTAAAVGILAKENACISGAAGGCQAEVGTASAMAAAGLCAVLGGSPDQVEEAAEIALEHSLGMTCDPVLGLVQVPCIERNTMGATRAVNAVSLALKASLKRRRSIVRYDDCLRVMHETGKDMNSKYRETAQGGLAADYDMWLRKQGKDKVDSVQDTMGLVRIMWGVQEPDEELPPVTFEYKVDTLARDRKNTVGLAKC